MKIFHPKLHVLGLGIHQRDEMIPATNPNVATAFAILFVGVAPVFVDVDRHFHMDINLLNSAVTTRTKVILSARLLGLMADMDKILPVAKEHNYLLLRAHVKHMVQLIEGKKGGSFGAVGCFNFYPTKI